MSDTPNRQPYSLSESAVALHEFFISLVVAGFTPDQALVLTASVINRGQAQ